MRYNQIRSMDISNGEGVGVSLFVQGCEFHCKGCFNTETWDFNGGKEWNEETKKKFLELLNRPYVKRVSILGGEPLASQNLDGVLDLIKEIRLSFPEKTIWLYTGYCLEDIFKPQVKCDIFTGSEKELVEDAEMCLRRQIISLCDVLVDGRYEEDKRDITKKWAGSTNQRVIDVKQSLKQNNIVLHCD